MTEAVTQKPEVPAGMVEMRDGSFLPKSKVKPLDLQRDKVVSSIFKKGGKVSDDLATFKHAAMDEVDDFMEFSASEYGAKLGGQKGNASLFSLDGRKKVEISVAEHISFNDLLQTAKALIDECMTDWMKGSNANLKAVVTGAFKVNKQGKVSREKLIGLRQYNIDDERWQRAMEAIANSEQVIGSKRYIRLYERNDKTGEYVRVSLDAASA